MTERNEQVEALLRDFVADKYRSDRRGQRRPGAELGPDDHMAECPDLTVAEIDAYDSTYGCTTGCEYARFEAVLTCPHGHREEWEWGDFGGLADIVEDLEARDVRSR